MKKFIFIALLISLILSTTITKNSTKEIDKKIFETNENLRILQDKYELTLLDYNYLTSPNKLIDYKNKYFDEELMQKDIHKIRKIYFEKDITIVEKLAINFDESANVDDGSCEYMFADINNDGIINILDIVQLVNIVLE